MAGQKTAPGGNPGAAMAGATGAGNTVAIPIIPRVHAENIPLEMRQAVSWLNWDFESRPGEAKPTKVPKRADGRGNAKSNDASTWCSFRTALQAYEAGRFHGIGLVFSAASRLVGIDLDGCRNPETGEIAAEAWRIVQRLNSYTEITPSGTGLHIIARGVLPPGRRRDGKIEMYDYSSPRFFTVTGNHLEGTPTTVENGEEAIKALHAELFPPKVETPQPIRPAEPTSLEDGTLLEMARRADNGAKFSRLWGGDAGDYAGDESRRDQALANILTFWTGRDAGRIDRLFRQSGCYRPKWDERRGAMTYGEMTIQKAIEDCTEVYTPSRAPSRNGHSAAPRKAVEDRTVDTATTGEVPARFPLTDAGMAEYFASMYAQDLRYDHLRGRYVVWKGHWWEPDTDGEPMRMVLRAVRRREEEILEQTKDGDPDARKKAMNKVLGFEQGPRLESILSIARKLHPITDNGKEWDKQDWLLGVANGVVDLRTGDLRDGRREDRITKHTPLSYDPGATCHTWLSVLARVLPDDDVRAFVHRLFGYSITGSTREQCLPFLYGAGRNGKSTVLGAILGTLGPDYSKQAAPDLLVYTKDTRHPTEIADLHGARFVASVEIEEGKRLAEVLVKQMTGGDRMKGREMHKNFFEFTPTHKIFLAANHKPIIHGTDLAIWRRIMLIPFTVTIPEEEQDKELPEKLAAEYPGILRWLVQGCVDWQQKGLNPPKTVRDATGAYKNEMDMLGRFLEDSCVVKPGAKVGATPLYTSYKQWCEANGERWERQQNFASYLAERGFIRTRSGPGGKVQWHGLGVLSTEGTEPTEAIWGISPREENTKGDLPISGSVPSVPSVDEGVL